MLELRIRADKTGSRTADGPWPIAGVEIVGKSPRDHNWADTRVWDGLKRGYITFENQRADVTSVTVDGEEKPYPRGAVVTGDYLVLHTADGEVRWKVSESPGIYEDDSVEAGYRISHEYKTRRV